MTWCLIISGVLLLAVAFACWVANAEPLEDWKDGHDLRTEEYLKAREAELQRLERQSFIVVFKVPESYQETPEQKQRRDAAKWN